MKMRDFLSSSREYLPSWLVSYAPGSEVVLSNFFESRILYYPGSGYDDQPLAVFAGAHAAHCFVYVDYGIKKSELEHDLIGASNFLRGYRVIGRLPLKNSDLVRRGCVQHFSLQDARSTEFSQGFVRPYVFLVLFERLNESNNLFGPQRIAIMFIAADGIATYDALFCQGAYVPPYAIVIQDHGFGGNYDSFGQGGLLEKLARECDAMPELALVSDNTVPWAGFNKLIDVEPARGGMHQQRRFLFKRLSKSVS